MRFMETKTIIKKAGGARAIAESLGISTQWVYQWQKVPPKYVKDVARMSGLKPEQIRPDVF